MTAYFSVIDSEAIKADPSRPCNEFVAITVAIHDIPECGNDEEDTAAVFGAIQDWKFDNSKRFSPDRYDIDDINWLTEAETEKARRFGWELPFCGEHDFWDRLDHDWYEAH